MASTSLSVEVHHVDTITGDWCETCLLPSVIRHRFVIVMSETLRALGRRSVWLCDECGEQGWIDEHDR